MKVFWSWQSDHPGRVSRHFVREALEKAISELKRILMLQKPPGIRSSIMTARECQDHLILHESFSRRLQIAMFL
jgi:hypothetical protein